MFPHRGSGTLLIGDTDGDYDGDVVITTRDSIEVHNTQLCGTGSGKAPTGACFVCPAFAVRIGNGDRCLECSLNQVAVSGVCQPCGPGYERKIGWNECTECASGMFTAGNGASCAECPAGTYAARTGSRECLPCGVGTYSSGVGVDACLECPIGAQDQAPSGVSHTPRGQTCEGTLCLVALPLSTLVITVPDHHICLTALPPPGSFCLEGSKTPAPCGRGRFGDAPARSDAQCSGGCDLGYRCPYGARTPTETAFAPVCEVGYTLTANPDTAIGGMVCEACSPDTMICDEPGLAIEAVPLVPSYWRQFNTTSATGGWIKKCFNEAACLGGTNMTSEGSACATGHRGAFCGVCEDNWLLAAEGLCAPCVGDMTLSFVPIGLLGAVVVLLIVMFIRGGKQMEAMSELAEQVADEGGDVQSLAMGKLEEKAAEANKAGDEGGGDGVSAKPSIKVRVVTCVAKAATAWGNFQNKLKSTCQTQCQTP